jgi:hypothetical protein
MIEWIGELVHGSIIHGMDSGSFQPGNNQVKKGPCNESTGYRVLRMMRASVKEMLKTEIEFGSEYTRKTISK